MLQESLLRSTPNCPRLLPLRQYPSCVEHASCEREVPALEDMMCDRLHALKYAAGLGVSAMIQKFCMHCRRAALQAAAEVRQGGGPPEERLHESAQKGRGRWGAPDRDGGQRTEGRRQDCEEAGQEAGRRLRAQAQRAHREELQEATMIGMSES